MTNNRPRSDPTYPISKNPTGVLSNNGTCYSLFCHRHVEKRDLGLVMAASINVLGKLALVRRRWVGTRDVVGRIERKGDQISNSLANLLYGPLPRSMAASVQIGDSALEGPNWCLFDGERVVQGWLFRFALDTRMKRGRATDH